MAHGNLEGDLGEANFSDEVTLGDLRVEVDSRCFSCEVTGYHWDFPYLKALRNWLLEQKPHKKLKQIYRSRYIPESSKGLILDPLNTKKQTWGPEI